MNKRTGFTEIENHQNIRECEIQYGEICAKCEKYIGDATGFQRLCDDCKINDTNNVT